MGEGTTSNGGRFVVLEITKCAADSGNKFLIYFSVAAVASTS